ncbi:MAG: hypothetical protein KGJ66_08085 [Alphaproteobacteria bacterium]|nr:hypothetical protein [Alphaproteobacteria bacterium]
MSRLDQESGLSHAAAFCDLAVAERLIVWSFRCWVSDSERWPLVWQEFTRQFPADLARPAMRAFEEFVAGICRRAHRVIHYHQPCCPCLGSDELHVLSIIAAAQRNDIGAAENACRRLVYEDGVEGLFTTAARLGRIMTSRGLLLPRRLDGAGDPAWMETEPQQWLH